MSNQDNIVSGDQIKGLFTRSDREEIIVDFKGKKIKFVIQPLDNDIYAKMGSSIIAEKVDMDIGDIANLKAFSNYFYPSMKIVLQHCCVNPKVIDGKSTDNNTLEIAQMPLDVCIELFTKCLDISGLSNKQEETRKK